MKKLLVLGSMLSALILTGGGCSTKIAPATPTGINSMMPGVAQTTASQSVKPQPTTPKPKVESTLISIANFAFSPETITVKAGTVVKWVNDDPVLHSIKSANGTFPGSADLNTGNTYEFKFDKPGVYDYFCGLYPAMRGQIVVE